MISYYKNVQTPVLWYLKSPAIRLGASAVFLCICKSRVFFSSKAVVTRGSGDTDTLELLDDEVASSSIDGDLRCLQGLTYDNP